MTYYTFRSRIYTHCKGFGGFLRQLDQIYKKKPFKINDLARLAERLCASAKMK